MTVWEWITSTMGAGDLLTTLGIGALAVLFATDRIMTKGQHERRTADLTKHHGRELAEKDARLAEVRESRDGWKAVALEERKLRDAATVGVAASATAALVDVKHVLESLDETLDGREGSR